MKTILITVLAFLAYWQNSKPRIKIYYPEIGSIDIPKRFPDTLHIKTYEYEYLCIIENAKGKANLNIYNLDGSIYAKGLYKEADSLTEENARWDDPITGATGSTFLRYYAPAKYGTWEYYGHIHR